MPGMNALGKQKGKCLQPFGIICFSLLESIVSILFLKRTTKQNWIYFLSNTNRWFSLCLTVLCGLLCRDALCATNIQQCFLRTRNALLLSSAQRCESLEQNVRIFFSSFFQKKKPKQNIFPNFPIFPDLHISSSNSSSNSGTRKYSSVSSRKFLLPPFGKVVSVFSSSKTVMKCKNKK